eukprot:366276-Chlamydomonas_euryale.AAC.3
MAHVDLTLMWPPWTRPWCGPRRPYLDVTPVDHEHVFAQRERHVEVAQPGEVQLQPRHQSRRKGVAAVRLLAHRLGEGGVSAWEVWTCEEKRVRRSSCHAAARAPSGDRGDVAVGVEV